MNSLEVWKFGGASLADGKAIQRAADQIASHRGGLVVVASALAGVTDLLLDGASHAVAGRTADASRAAQVFRQKHHQAIRLVARRGSAARALLALVDASAREYEDVCSAVAV